MNCEKVFIVLKAAKICRKLEKELKGKEWNELKSKGRQIYEFSLTFNGGKKENSKKQKYNFSFLKITKNLLCNLNGIWLIFRFKILNTKFQGEIARLFWFFVFNNFILDNGKANIGMYPSLILLWLPIFWSTGFITNNYCLGYRLSCLKNLNIKQMITR